MVISWTALTTDSDKGSSDITAYNLVWDEGNSGGSVETSLYEGTSTTFSLTGLTSGQNYRFKVRAKNVYGYGDYSAEATLSSSSVPGTVTTLTTAYSTYPDIEIDWSAPTSNGGKTITKYEVVIYKPSTGTFIEDTTYCDASQGTVLTNTKCTFTVTYLMTTYGYARGDLV